MKVKKKGEGWMIVPHSDVEDKKLNRIMEFISGFVNKSKQSSGHK